MQFTKSLRLALNWDMVVSKNSVVYPVLLSTWLPAAGTRVWDRVVLSRTGYRGTRSMPFLDEALLSLHLSGGGLSFFHGWWG